MIIIFALSFLHNQKLFITSLMEKIKLEVAGVVYSQQPGVFTLYLEDKIGKRQLPIMIGPAEAQSIYIALEKLPSPRPLTHDLFKSVLENFKIIIEEVVITRIHEGVFYSYLICTDGVKTFEIDSRTSDAVAMALRFNCPIYASKSVMDMVSIIEGGDKKTEKEKQEDTSENHQEKENIYFEDPSTATENEFENYSLKELKEMLDDAIAKEEYERASKIRDEIKKRTK